MRTEVRPFDAAFIDDGAALLAARHRAHRAAAPGLDPAFEDRAIARKELERLVATAGTSGAIALRGGTPVGYLLGTPQDPETWGPNTWVVPAGHAVAEPDLVRALYAVAAARWVEEGATRHYALVPASDRDLVEAWFSLGFGQQHVHALRECPPASFRPVAPDNIMIRPATRADVPSLAVMDVVLARHQAGSPVFSMLPIPSLEESQAELEADFDDPRFTTLVAVHDGRVVGSALCCSLEESRANHSLIRPASAGFLGFAAVLPEARGLGAGRALGEAVLAWSRDAGYPWVAADWRATSLEAAGAWTALGFQPTFLRLHRAIV